MNTTEWIKQRRINRNLFVSEIKTYPMKKENRSKQFWIKEFKQFLREHSVAAQYYNNARLCNDEWPFREKDSESVDKRLSEIYDEFGVQAFVQWGFKWSDTVEGWEGWRYIDEYWICLINEELDVIDELDVEIQEIHNT